MHGLLKGKLTKALAALSKAKTLSVCRYGACVQRHVLPQIRTVDDHRSLVAWFKRHKITVDKKTVHPAALTPTQTRIDLRKVDALMEKTSQQPVYAAKDGKVLLDGHHRWAAAVGNGDATVPVWEIDASFDVVLKHAQQWERSR